MSDSSNKATKTAESSAKPVATRNLPAEAFSSSSRSDEGKSKDFDSVILDLDADESGDLQQAAGNQRAAESEPDAAAGKPVSLGAESLRVPQELVRAAALDQIGPEHFRRTLIAATRATLPPESTGRAPRGIRIATHAVEARLEDPRLLMIHEPDSPRAASLRVLRHRLVEHGDPRTIVVTSPEVGDGKTMCATNLAITLSECGRARVLLFEANFRRPGLARMLGMKPPICLTQQMAEHHQNPEAAPWAAAQIISPWLHVLAIDTDTFRGPRLIDGPAFENTIAQLKLVGYDYIVLDAPSVLGSADVNLVQEVADGVLLALTARRSSTRALRAALDQLTQTKVVGVALFGA